MRPAPLALGVGLLGACFGAAMVGVPPRDEAPSTQGQGVHAKRAIDHEDEIPLEPVRGPADLGQTAMRHVRRLVAFGPRHAVTTAARVGWTRQLEYIDGELKRLGLKVERDTWKDPKEGITFTNLSAVIPGRRARRILLCCHHDTKCTSGHPRKEHNFRFVGANDGASGVALLLALAPVLAEKRHEATIELVFFDGEESLDWDWNDAERALFGSKRYVRRYVDGLLLGRRDGRRPSRIAAMILLDMVGRTDLHIQDELYSTTKMRRIVWSAATACGHEKNFYQVAEAASDDHYPFLEHGIPSVDLIDLRGNPYWHTPNDTIEHMSAESLQKVGDVVLTMLPAVEKAYLPKPR